MNIIDRKNVQTSTFSKTQVGLEGRFYIKKISLKFLDVPNVLGITDKREILEQNLYSNMSQRSNTGSWSINLSLKHKSHHQQQRWWSRV